MVQGRLSPDDRLPTSTFRIKAVAQVEPLAIQALTGDHLIPPTQASPVGDLDLFQHTKALMLLDVDVFQASPVMSGDFPAFSPPKAEGNWKP